MFQGGVMWVTKRREVGHKRRVAPASGRLSRGHLALTDAGETPASTAPGRRATVRQGLSQTFSLAEFADNVGNGAMLAVHGVVQGAHVIVSYFACQCRQSGPQF